MTEEMDDPTDALEALGNETRLAILRTLAEADGPLAFSELRERVGIRDSGKFNYHLSRLCEYFVRERQEGYELGHAGTRLIATTDAAGSDELEGGTDPEPCPVCGEDNCEKLIHVHLRTPWFDSA
ncbi:ArsR/SmtB family transcription factor [Natronobacterium texcoconense]|uniref:Helix-turn-helix domain-containing protein n=1 Tax=Natronobacterium texcoconense TaxID=1095778 RepID=A0A1H0ZF45_NATTX|nr:winged helix-turn-helix domain-containing protein [Natronobacterium texcoconense]SDQ26088.1 Helix-turn-helix domain-containing protein [Natronobacterium texcoconense]